MLAHSLSEGLTAFAAEFDYAEELADQRRCRAVQGSWMPQPSDEDDQQSEHYS